MKRSDLSDRFGVVDSWRGLQISEIRAKSLFLVSDLSGTSLKSMKLEEQVFSSFLFTKVQAFVQV